MKFLIRLLIWIVFIVLLIGGGIWIYMVTITPNYSGSVNLKGLKSATQVTFDSWGIPHIEAENKEDLYRTFGYVHAQERLFQMELMRRVGSGTLSEVLGEDLLEADVLFRTLGIPEDARKNADRIDRLHKNEEYYKLLQAYLDGVNEFVENGNKPVEFSLMGIPRKKFTTYDVYCIAGYMAFSFNLGTRTDPLVTEINNSLGTDYLEDLGWYAVDTTEVNRATPNSAAVLSGMSVDVQRIIQNLPVVPFMGSNSWAISGSKTESGKTMLSNDTHIGYGMPAVWYEAHLKSPDFDFYGNFLGGIPFALIGHNRDVAWGVTILEEDDCDFYIEEFDPNDSTRYRSGDGWKELTVRTDTINIGGERDTVISTPITHHGPVVNGAFSQIKSEAPVSMWWNYKKFDNNLLQVFHGLNHSSNISETEEHVGQIHGPGLNIVYADEVGNIAWWSATKFLKRADHVKGKLFLDGASGLDEPEGFYSFDFNPKSINPKEGYVYSANDQPATVDSVYYPGYYKPKHRAMRINQLLKPGNSWNTEKMKSVITDVKSPVDSELSAELYKILKSTGNWDTIEKEALEFLQWDGNHRHSDISPTIYYRLLYYTIHGALGDELSPEQYDLFTNTHLIKKAYPRLLVNAESKWWDDVSTDATENRQMIISTAFDEAISSLKKQLGEDVSNWNWGKIHTLELEHPLGKVGVLRPFFNVGPHPLSGGYETINQADFLLDNDGKFQVKGGPQMRIIIDFSDVENSISISPSGQSGHVYSEFYSDQAEMYREGLFREQSMSIPENSGLIKNFKP